jgi:hypothetical protein
MTILTAVVAWIAVIILCASIVDGWIGLLATLVSDVFGAVRRSGKGSRP